ncbi:extracellular solute-binding protein [Bacillaceae bacterium SIJ1]|uniref:extracellular solute-binding protein n=1 Tax=Litoribacterium kuwaitense TaxID=1398745 RepID=UPI0013EA997B|nr:extracellular solute-binding protein [Litoribacterium kuwaitense]NGP46317.1 extracellular solute-binding protein [Litoribacterium kuwaitense]
MKKWFGVIGMAVLLLVSACSSDDATSTNPDAKVVRVALAGWNLEDGLDAITGNETKGLNTFLEESFYPDNPDIKMELTTVPWENAQAKMNALLQSGDVDVIYTGGAFASMYSKQGLLRGLDDLIEQDDTFDSSIYLEGVWEDSYSTKSFDKETHFGLPAVLGRRVTIFDKKLFDDWGVEYLSENPTPEEVLEKAKQMTGTNPVTGEQNYGLWFNGTAINGSTIVALSHALGAAGAEGSLAEPENLDWQLTSPEMVEVMNWLGEAAKYAPPAFINGEGAENFGMEGNNIGIALDHAGSSTMSEFRESGDTTLLERFAVSKNLGPNGEGWVAVDPFIMAKDAQNVDAAWEVMKFLAGPEVQEYRYENFTATPTLANADFVNEEDKYMKVAMEIADIAETSLLDEANPFFTSDIVPEINRFVSEAHNGNTPDPQAFLEELQKRAEAWSANQ